MTNQTIQLLNQLLQVVKSDWRIMRVTQPTVWRFGYGGGIDAP